MIYRYALEISVKRQRQFGTYFVWCYFVLNRAHFAERVCGDIKWPRGVYKYEFICNINCFMNKLGIYIQVVDLVGLNNIC